MTSYLFPEDNDIKPAKPRVKGRIQKDLLEWMRSGKIITEDLFFSEIGGRSVTAAFSNLKRRGYLAEDEAIVRIEGKDSKGEYTPAYRLAKIPINGAALDPLPPLTEYEDPEDVLIEDTQPHVFPEVRSIGVHVSNGKPLLVITFEGEEYRPFEHVLDKMEVSYLLANLEPFRMKKRGEPED